MGWAVNVVDTVDWRMAQGAIYDLRRNEPDATIIKIPASAGGVTYMVSAVLNATRPRGMNVLRIFGHGYGGYQNVGGGLSSEAYAYCGCIDLDHLDGIASLLASLSSRFYSSHSRLELRGCEVASTESGNELITRLAKIVGVRVLAATDAQCDYEWDGPVYQAEPSGQVKCIAYTA